MTTDTTLSNLEEASNAPHDPHKIDILRDHVRRCQTALGGFAVYGSKWFWPWLTYCMSPLLARIAPGAIVHFHNFDVRLGHGDLYTFANVFADYPIDKIARAIGEVELIVDLGANVGAFSCVALSLGRKLGRTSRIVALEPESENADFLRRQPFAGALDIHEAAVGPDDGRARLILGNNSVTHHVDFSERAGGELVRVVSLRSLCDAPALVKMDIEGAELNILQDGLPDNVRHLVLEWHYDGTPADFLPGNWTKTSTDLHGASTWHFCR
jgi:FkbM family methyltransferase